MSIIVSYMRIWSSKRFTLLCRILLTLVGLFGLTLFFGGVLACIPISLSWTPPYPPEKRIKSYYSWGGVGKFLKSLFGCPDKSESGDDDSEEYDPAPYSAANLPRFALLLPPAFTISPPLPASLIFPCS